MYLLPIITVLFTTDQHKLHTVTATLHNHSKSLAPAAVTVLHSSVIATLRRLQYLK